MKTRDDWPSFALSCRLNLPVLLRWLLMMSVLAGPGHAYAADTKCTGLNSSMGTIKLQLPASVSFDPEGDLKPYLSSPAKFDYTCSASDGASHTVGIIRLGDMSPLIDAFNKAGLKLEVLVSDSSGGGESVWDFSVKNPAEYVNVGSSYIGTTGNRTMTFRTRLTRDQTKPKPNPGFYVVPGLTSFKLIPDYYSMRIGPFLETPPVRLQYVPACFVRTRLGTNKVNFGPILTSDVDSTVSRRIDFNVIADVNKSCNNGTFGNLLGSYTVSVTGGTTNYYLKLPLKVSFILNNGGEASSDRKSILLYKESTSDKNGLQLEIKAPDGNPVTFNEASLPVNEFGIFQGAEGGGAWNIINTYQAVLSSTGEQVKTGKYSAQVTVKVDYY
ncbi:fimbrial protein [Salmonella enterica subsp. enterica serovar Newport]|uniref:Fimbrial protein n=1 Tax=Salmonella enterica TaxID=28901 RepID=A0A754B755_SALER|nr:fimbrial protein [Salmonella enterica]EFT1986929.1 fimbrial protein [Salmonella enterica]EHR8190569.1 fimbrial protein [Salmonella enterica]HAF8581184.1 fimbrial protein [Salmonella enterica]HEC7849189.1 fimbrial protein [Salmonella enterica subsp. enterica serovar Newport]